MKKTLIALAVVAVSGTAFAQSTVTLSGKLRFAFESTDVTTTGVQAKANGLRVTDGDFVLTAVEDLGGGLKAAASMAVQSRGRDTGISGRDASLSLMGGFGTVMIGSVEAANGIYALGSAGAPVYGMDGSVIAAASNVDILRYMTPDLIPGLKASFSLIDNTAASANGTLGFQKAHSRQDATVLGVTYAAGPVAAALDFTNYGRNSAAIGTDGVTSIADDRLRMSASYDLGVAKLGFGYQKMDLTIPAASVKDMILGVSAPMGPVVVGVNYATSQRTGGVKVKGLDLGVQYNLSKRTYVAAHYQKVDNRADNTVAGVTTTTTNATSENSKYRIQLSHAF